MGREHLERDRTLEPVVPALIHDGHAAAAELSSDAVRVQSPPPGLPPSPCAWWCSWPCSCFFGGDGGFVAVAGTAVTQSGLSATSASTPRMSVPARLGGTRRASTSTIVRPRSSAMSRRCAHAPSPGIRRASVVSWAASARASIGCCALSAPQAVSPLQAASETLSKHVRKPGCANRRLRSLHVVDDTPEDCPLRVEVNQQPGRVGVAVPRLTHRAGVEQKAVLAERELRVRRREAAHDAGPVTGKRKRDMAVADENERRRGEAETLVRHLVAEHVLPDRVARARVEQLDVLA